MYKKFNTRKYSKGGTNDNDHDYIFDENGNFVRRKETTDKVHYAVFYNPKTKKMERRPFADQANDPNNAESPEFSKMRFIYDKDIIREIGDRGGINESNRYKNPAWFGANSTGMPFFSKFDYATNHLQAKYSDVLKGKSYDEDLGVYYDDGLKYADNVFFVPESDSHVHNTYNMGNFYWGATGHSLGFSEKTLHKGADFNNKYNPIYRGRRLGGSGKPDSEDDKFSQSRGVNFAKKYKLYNKEWNKNKGLIPKKEYNHFNYIIP